MHYGQHNHAHEYSYVRTRGASPQSPVEVARQGGLAQLRESSEFRQALQRLAPSRPDSDAALTEVLLLLLLHAIFEARLAAVRAAAEEGGYRLLGEQYVAQRQERRHVARRRNPGWADEW